MVTNNHPCCQKPEDCRVYRAGERVCPKCQGIEQPMSDRQRKLYHKTQRMFGSTRAKRIVLEDSLG